MDGKPEDVDGDKKHTTELKFSQGLLLTVDHNRVYLCEKQQETDTVGLWTSDSKSPQTSSVGGIQDVYF